MTEEMMQFMAKAAADSYMANLSIEDKNYLSEHKDVFTREYFKVFEIGLDQLTKREAKRFEEFGDENLSKAFK